MSKQKFIVFLIAIIGMIATFLPWYEVSAFGTVMGYQTAGWFTFMMFTLAFLFALRGKLKDDVTMGLMYLGSAFTWVAAFIVLWRVILIYLNKEGAGMSLATNLMAHETRILYGAYQVIIAGICLPFGAFLFRNRKKSEIRTS